MAFNQQTADTICDLLSDGTPLREICRMPNMPAWRTVYLWKNEHPDFDARFARAREIGFDAIAEEALEIANTPVQGVETTEKANGDIETKTGDMLGHRKLQIETRLKLLAKWSPKKYGERTTLAGDPDAPLIGKIERVVINSASEATSSAKSTDTQ